MIRKGIPSTEFQVPILYHLILQQLSITDNKNQGFTKLNKWTLECDLMDITGKYRVGARTPASFPTSHSLHYARMNVAPLFYFKRSNIAMSMLKY